MAAAAAAAVVLAEAEKVGSEDKPGLAAAALVDKLLALGAMVVTVAMVAIETAVAADEVAVVLV